jgi:crotonobetainyl-CoA:carnitine CoA-transferase CaiB-like acyl-CoA transferase
MNHNNDTQTTSSPLLHDVRIIELCDAEGPSLAAQLLAECGADVIRIEPPGGSAARREPGFAVRNRSKRCMTLELPRERATLDRLLATADVLLHDRTPAQARAEHLDDAAIAARFPHLIISNVTGMPQGHPEQEMPAIDALVLARGGVFDTLRAQRRDGPAYLRFPLGQQCAAWLTAIGILARLHVRKVGGGAGAVRTSLLQGALVPLLMHWHRAEHPTDALTPPPKDMVNVLVQCADGKWLHIMSPVDHCPSVKVVLDELGEAALADARARNQPYLANLPLFPLYADIFRRRGSREWLEELWAHDVAVEAAAPFGQLYFDEQSRINDYVIEVDDPQWGRVLQPGTPLSITPPAGLRWPLRPAGADTDAILRELDTAPRVPEAAPASRQLARPLEGLKVLDLGNFLAGPLAALLLADLGATVIKLEATAGDPMRWVEWAFSGAQRGKRCIAVDLKNPASRPIVERLVRWADIVHHNLRMPAAEKLGLDYASLRAINPRIVYCHVSAYGPRGPRKDWPGYDQMMQSSAGWEVACAGEGNIPQWVRLGMTDHLCALSSLLATMVALHERDRSGEGQFVSASLLGATALTLAETMARPDGSMLDVAQLDAQQCGVSPRQRMHRCRDGWISLVAPDAATLQRFAQSCGAADASALTDTLLTLSQVDAIARAGAAGACATRVVTAGEHFLDDPDYQRLGLTASYPHPVYGRFEQIGAFWHFPDMPTRIESGPPTVGQHTTQILGELGFPQAEIDSMMSAGLVRQTLKMSAS